MVTDVLWFISVCPEGTHGTYCSEVCDCLNGAKCSPVTGQCKCLNGYHGDRCEKGKTLHLIKILLKEFKF